MITAYEIQLHTVIKDMYVKEIEDIVDYIIENL
jgi:hypothetical protein